MFTKKKMMSVGVKTLLNSMKLECVTCEKDCAGTVDLVSVVG